MTEQGGVAIVLVVVVGVLLAVAAGKAVRIVPQTRVGLVERLGRYLRTIPPGVNLVAPFVDQVRLVDTRDQELDLPPTSSRTADAVDVTIEARLRYRITEPVKAVYEVASYQEALTKLATTALRELLAGKTVNEAQASYHELAWDLRGQLVGRGRVWGIEIAEAEIRAIRPSTAT